MPKNQSIREFLASKGVLPGMWEYKYMFNTERHKRRYEKLVKTRCPHCHKFFAVANKRQKQPGRPG